jgi:hypothetical protein
MSDVRVPSRLPDGSWHTPRLTWPDVGVLALGLGYAVFLTKFGGMGAREAAITATLTVAAIVSVRSISRGILALVQQLRGINTALAVISTAAGQQPSAPTPMIQAASTVESEQGHV